MKEFIETLRSRLKDLQCLSCAKTFKDRNTLKDHMRKKSHRGLNKDDRSFDKFYLINYLEMGKRWTQVSLKQITQTVRIPGQTVRILGRPDSGPTNVQTKRMANFQVNGLFLLARVLLASTITEL